LEIPNDVAVIGFDDIDISSSLAVPLSTIRAPIQELGAQGVDLLCSKIADGSTAPENYRLPVELVVRESTQPSSTTGSPLGSMKN